MPKQIDFRLRYQVREDTPHATLFKYLQSKETEFSPRQMVLSSLTAFWQAQAYQWSGQYSEERLQAIARLSIGELRQQIKYLACTFGLEKELLEAGSFSAMEHNAEGLPSVAPNQFKLPESAAQTPELPYHSDDELLEQMFN